MRHADAGTALKVYAHLIPQSQRDSMERIANRSIGTKVPNGTRAVAWGVDMKVAWFGAVEIENNNTRDFKNLQGIRRNH